MLVLDNIEGWTLTPEQASKYHNDLNALSVLWFGLEHLYAEVLKCERSLSQQHMTMSVESEQKAAGSKVLARCVFDWYAVSSCNFVSLVGWMANQAGLTTGNQRTYVTRVLPAVEIHRNKIAAHFSRHSPMNDSEALQRASTMWFSVAQVNGRFVANALTFRMQKGGVSSDSSELRPWSVVEVHEALRERYAIKTQPCGQVHVEDPEASAGKDQGSGSSRAEARVS